MKIFNDFEQSAQIVADRAEKLRDVAKFSNELKPCIRLAIDIEIGNDNFIKLSNMFDISKTEYVDYIYNQMNKWRAFLENRFALIFLFSPIFTLILGESIDLLQIISKNDTFWRKYLANSTKKGVDGENKPKK